MSIHFLINVQYYSFFRELFFPDPIERQHILFETVAAHDKLIESTVSVEIDVETTVIIYVTLYANILKE